MKKWLWFICIMITISALTACSGGGDEAGSDQAKSDRGKTTTQKWDKPPAMAIDPNKNYQAEISTNKGNITVELLAKDAPKTVNNFIFLAKQHFYNNVLFHRVIKNFMIQTGDPTGTGAGGPGYTFEDELPPKYKYEKGIVAMANAGPNTNGGQFFICNGPDSESLNAMPNYTIFGRVVDGMDTVEKISDVKVKNSPTGEASVPTEEVYIKSITIKEK